MTGIGCRNSFEHSLFLHSRTVALTLAAAVHGFLLLATVFYFNWISSGSGGGFRIRIPIPWLQPKMGFIGRNETHFVEVEDGTPVYVNGWNSYWLISSKLEEISEMFRRGRAMGMTVCRTWAFSDGGANALQISPGRFNECLFQAYREEIGGHEFLWMILMFL